eukprot:SAG31_NODE_17268_length_677_cov_1.152249_1_plen_62_part_10
MISLLARRNDRDSPSRRNLYEILAIMQSLRAWHQLGDPTGRNRVACIHSSTPGYGNVVISHS